VARGEDNEDSDIDLLIVSSKKQETNYKLMKKVIDILPKLGIYIFRQSHFKKRILRFRKYSLYFIY